MTIDGQTVRVMNEAYSDINLTPARADELPIELEQLRQAIEAVRGKVDFDIDPFDFRAALLALAEEGSS